MMMNLIFFKPYQTICSFIREDVQSRCDFHIRGKAKLSLSALSQRCKRMILEVIVLDLVEKLEKYEKVRCRLGFSAVSKVLLQGERPAENFFRFVENHESEAACGNS